jgi:hypothetical protein
MSIQLKKKEKEAFPGHLEEILQLNEEQTCELTNLKTESLGDILKATSKEVSEETKKNINPKKAPEYVKFQKNHQE